MTQAVFLKKNPPTVCLLRLGAVVHCDANELVDSGPFDAVSETMRHSDFSVSARCYVRNCADHHCLQIIETVHSPDLVITGAIEQLVNHGD